MSSVTFSGLQRRLVMRSTLFLTTFLLAQPALAGAPAQVSATRTERFDAPGAVQSLTVVAISGQVKVTAGTTFAATVEVVARGADKAAADAALARTKVVFSFDDGKASLRTELDSNGRHREEIATNYTMTVPATAGVKVHTVDGSVKVEGVSGPVTADTVNGSVDITGNSPDLRARTVNGKVQARLGTLPASARVSAETVSGEVLLWLPAGAPVRLSAQTLSGEILSTFPFPPRAPRGRGWSIERHYEGETGTNGAQVRLRSVSGKLTVCASGTTVAAAKPLVSATGAFSWEGPRKRGRGEDGDVKLDKVIGDFDFDSPSGDVKVETVTGRVKLRTQSGDVHLGSVGGAADIETGGGDIRLQSVAGELRVRTGGGDLRIDTVGGNARLETLGGDIRVDTGRGAILATTRGGDISLRHAQGTVQAETDGGDVSVAVTGRPKGKRPEVDIATKGGDVTLTLPANLAADFDIEVLDADEESRIVSEFPQVAPTRKGHVQSAAGKLGGGGPLVKVRARSGKVTIKRGPNL